MKAKILLLSLATLLLVAFQSCSNEIEPTLLSIQNSESMETKTEIVSTVIAGMIQINAPAIANLSFSGSACIFLPVTLSHILVCFSFRASPSMPSTVTPVIWILR